MDRIGVGRFRGIYIADERKKRSFLERRRAANDPWLWALHDHQVGQDMLLYESNTPNYDFTVKEPNVVTNEREQGSITTAINTGSFVAEKIDELEKEAEENTKLFSPNLYH